MVSSSFLAYGFFMKAVAFIWVLCALALIFIILIQKGKGGGLSGAFGGGMASSVLGANTKKPLTWFTIGLVSFYLLAAVLLAMYYKPTVSTPVEQPATQQTSPAQPATPAGGTGQTTVPAPATGQSTTTAPAGGAATDTNAK